MTNCPTIQAHHDSHPPKIDAMVQSRIDDINDITRRLTSPEPIDPFEFMALSSRFGTLADSIEALTGIKFEAYRDMHPEKFRI